jgi:phage FluMu gp28-like protein
MQLAENMIAKHGSKVEAVDFNIANKEKMATGVKAEFEERRMRIPEAPSCAARSTR